VHRYTLLLFFFLMILPELPSARLCAQTPFSLASIRFPSVHLIGLSKAVVESARRAYSLSGNGTLNREFGFALVQNDDGTYSTTAIAGFEAGRVKIPVTSRTVAFFHTHRNATSARPSDQDMKEADDKRLAVFVISSRGLWIYEPDPKRKGKGPCYQVKRDLWESK
jgi:uncharacterized protein DUF4329